MKWYERCTVLILLLALTACANDEREDVTFIDISFSPAIKNSSRSEGGTRGIYPEAMPFGVWVYRLPSEEKWSTDHANAQPLLNNAMVTYADGYWEPKPPTKWPGNERLSFFAYAPYDANVTFSKEGGIEFRDFDVALGVEPMYAQPIVDCDKIQTNGHITTLFMQTLAKVEFKVRSIIHPDYKIHLKSLTIDDVAHKGSFTSLPNPKWKLADETDTLEFCDKETELGLSSKLVGEKMVIPQLTNKTVKVLFDIYNDKGEMHAPDVLLETENIEVPWNIGKIYTYNLVLSATKATFITDIFDMLYMENNN